MFKGLREDIKAAKRNDPAARNKFEIWLTYSGVHALSWHRVAYFFHKIHLTYSTPHIQSSKDFFRIRYWFPIFSTRKGFPSR